MGLEAHAQPAARIVRSGKLPLVVALVEPKRPRRRAAVTAVETIPSLEDQVAAIEAAENDRLFTRPRAMIDAVLDAIRRTRDAAIKPGCCDARRSRVEAVENWDARAASGSLVMAAATPKGAVVLTTDDWSEIDANAFGAAQFEGGGAAPTAIETTEGATSSSAAGSATERGADHRGRQIVVGRRTGCAR